MRPQRTSLGRPARETDYASARVNSGSRTCTAATDTGGVVRPFRQCRQHRPQRRDRVARPAGERPARRVAAPADRRAPTPFGHRRWPSAARPRLPPGRPAPAACPRVEDARTRRPRSSASRSRRPRRAPPGRPRTGRRAERGRPQRQDLRPEHRRRRVLPVERDAAAGAGQARPSGSSSRAIATPSSTSPAADQIP